MPTSTTSRRRLAALAAACLLSVALPTTAAFAQKTKTKEAPVAEAPAVATSAELTIDIPTIDAVDSNVDDDTLRAIFSGAIIDNATALAGLTATSITIPTISFDVTRTIDGASTPANVTLSDVELTDVAEGVATSVTMAGMSVDSGDGGTAEFGALTASNLDIGGMLGMYGLVDTGGQTEFETIYSEVAFEGGTVTSPEGECIIGAATSGEFKARPLNYSLAEIMAVGDAMDAEEGDPSSETIGKALRIYADLLTAFESSPTQFDGIDCDLVDEDGRPLVATIAGVTMGGMSPGLYPAISLDGIEVDIEGQGSVSVGNVTFKGMDISGPIATVQAAPEAIDEVWLEANARALIPAFEGLSFGDVAIDVPDPETEGGRINASIGAFDLTLAEYVNGVPSDILTTASNIVFTVPADTADPQLQQLLALGVTSIDAGFTVDANWNEADDTVDLTEVSITGADLATVVLAGTIANATEALFATDENEAMAAAMSVALASLKLDVTDAGLSDIILTVVAAEQGASAEMMRPVFAGLAQGTIVGMLAGAAEAQKVGGAVNSFVSGQAKQLIIELTAKEAPGLGMMDFMAAEEDPTVLIGKVTIDATAK